MRRPAISDIFLALKLRHLSLHIALSYLANVLFLLFIFLLFFLFLPLLLFLFVLCIVFVFLLFLLFRLVLLLFFFLRLVPGPRRLTQMLLLWLQFFEDRADLLNRLLL